MIVNELLVEKTFVDPKQLAQRLSQQLEREVTPPHRGEPSAPPQVADHRLHACIGKGSYGEVWLAQSLLGQWRAVKVIIRHRFTSDRPYEREFHGILQFEPISRTHPGLVHILHVGRDDTFGQFHYIMELADPIADALLDPASVQVLSKGSVQNYRPRTLASDLASRGRLPVSEVVNLGVELCGALGHIHRHGLVHRDVKPANVIFVGGQAKLADVGLVTQAHEAHSFVGTEGYIPPEGPGSIRADLYALGKLLYEAATGKRPDEFPELPPDLDQLQDREGILELNEVISRLCSSSLADRYNNAAEVAGDLNLILGGRSIREAKQLLHRLRTARRIVGIALLVAAVAVSAIAFQGRLRARAEERARTESKLKQRALNAEQESKRQLATALFEQARANLLSRELGQRVLSLEAVSRAARITNFAELRGEALAALTKTDLRLIKEIPFDPTHGRSLDPNFERVAVFQDGHAIEIRSVNHGGVLSILENDTNEPVHFALWDTRGRYLALRTGKDVEGYKANLELWDVDSHRRILQQPKCVSHSAVCFSPTGETLLTADASGHAVIWESATGNRRQSFEVHPTPMTLRISPDGNQFATLSYETDHSDLNLYDIETGKNLLSSKVPLSLGLEWNLMTKALLLFGVEGAVRQLDLASETWIVLGQHKAQAVSGAVHPSGRYLITGGWEAELICWDLQRIERAFTIGVNSWRPGFSRDGTQCALDGIDRLQIYTLEIPNGITEFNTGSATGAQIAQAALSTDGRWIASGFSEGFQVWDMHAPFTPTTVSNSCYQVMFETNNHRIYAYQEGELSEWEIPDTQTSVAPGLNRLSDSSVPDLQSVVRHSDSLWFSTRTEVYRRAEGAKEATRVFRLPNWFPFTRLSSDSRWVVAWSQSEPQLELFNLREGSHAATLKPHADVWTFALSPQGTELIVATRLGLEVYRTDTWERVRELHLPSERQSRILFSPDGLTFWHASDRRTAGLRAVNNLEMLLPLPPGVRPLALQSDGEHLAVSVDGTRFQLWDLPKLRSDLLRLGLDWKSNPASPSKPRTDSEIETISPN